MRQCMGCRQVFPQRELLRLVKQPDGAIRFDPSGKAPGRGGYVCPEIECLRKASKTRQPRFNLSPTDMKTLVEEMRTHCADGISRSLTRAARMGYLGAGRGDGERDHSSLSLAFPEGASIPPGYSNPVAIKQGYPLLPALVRDLKLLERLSSEVL